MMMKGTYLSWRRERQVERNRHLLLEMTDELSRKQGEAGRRLAERQVAVRVAVVRERLVWFVPFFVSSASFLYAGFRHTKNSVVLYPLIPMLFGLCYQLDYAYGNKTTRIKDIAEHIMTKEKHMIYVPKWHYANVSDTRGTHAHSHLLTARCQLMDIDPTS
ncbi:plasminogen receptor (KT)-like [Panulirus ornatus]|uniref:plasminogen receptor (KT)-like n=1 Tax=Panulirus ornatus TaxID=150431 RepID=UPI003A84466F